MDWNQILESARPPVVNVAVEMPYNDSDGQPVKKVFPLGLLTYGEWLGIEAECPEPPVPRTLKGVNGVSLPNRDDVTYRIDVANVMNERAYRRLALAFERGGVTIPGKSAADKAKVIREMDASVANALMTYLATAAFGGKAQAEAAADTFRGD